MILRNEEDFKNLWETKKPEDDLDVLKELINILRENNIKEDKINLMLSDPFIKAIENKHSYLQKLNLSKYWNNQIIFTNDKSIVTVPLRYSLLYDGTPDEWLIIFKDIILPYIKENDLPK